MSLQYRNVMFANVDVDDSRVRILDPSMGIHKIQMQCLWKSCLSDLIDYIVNFKSSRIL